MRQSLEKKALKKHGPEEISRKCYGSTSVSKTESLGSTPSRGAIYRKDCHENITSLVTIISD